MADVQKHRVGTTNDDTPAEPAEAYEEMDRRDATVDRSRTTVGETDQVVANSVAFPAAAGFVAGGSIGVVLGLLASAVDLFGISWWAGIAIGFFVGVTIGGLVSARLALNKADGGESGTYNFRERGGNSQSH